MEYWFVFQHTPPPLTLCNLTHLNRGMGSRVEYHLYPIHRTAEWSCFSSASLDHNVAVHFTRNKAGTIFVIHSTRCKNIETFSVFPSEKEVVFPTNTQFHVVGHLPTTHLRLIEQPCRVILMIELTNSAQQQQQQQIKVWCGPFFLCYPLFFLFGITQRRVRGSGFFITVIPFVS